MDVIDLNIKVAIAFLLALIVALLTYIAFFKNPEKKKTSRSLKKAA